MLSKKYSLYNTLKIVFPGSINLRVLLVFRATRGSQFWEDMDPGNTILSVLYKEYFLLNIIHYASYHKERINIDSKFKIQHEFVTAQYLLVFKMGL